MPYDGRTDKSTRSSIDFTASTGYYPDDAFSVSEIPVLYATAELLSRGRTWRGAGMHNGDQRLRDEGKVCGLVVRVICSVGLERLSFIGTKRPQAIFKAKGRSHPFTNSAHTTLTAPHEDEWMSRTS